MNYIQLPLTPKEKFSQLQIIAKRLERFLKLDSPSPLFFDDLEQLLILILEQRSNSEEEIISNLFETRDI